MIEYKEEILINEEYIKALLAAINHAQHTIDMEVYIFESDSVGHEVADALCRAAKRGVQIRLLVDGIGSINWGGELRNQMEACGIKTKVFHPLPWKISHWPSSPYVSKFIIYKLIALISKINNRNHRKVCIIDERIVFVGSANIYDHSWRETCVKLTDIDPKEIQYAFNKAWGKIPLKKRLNMAFRNLNADATFLLNYSWRLRHLYYQSLLQKISQCQNKIWVTNAYFVPDSHLLKRLRDASRRGADVRILLPEKSDVPIMSMVTSAFYSMLLKSGVKIYEYSPTVLHAKVLIIDDWYSIGSSNLNYRSFKHDLEVSVVIQSKAAKEIIAAQFQQDLGRSRQLQLTDVNNQSFFKKDDSAMDITLSLLDLAAFHAMILIYWRILLWIVSE